MAGAKYYPLADRAAQWFEDDYPGSVITPEKLVIHSTETVGWPGYGGGKSAPHVTVRGDFANERLLWRQHFSFLRNSRALRNEDGGVQTNIDGALQIEIVGTCNRKYAGVGSYLKMWDLPDWAIIGLGEFVRWLNVEHGIRLAHPALWPAYPSSPEKDDAARMSGAEWDRFRGVCGHLHVPENTHLDPGDIDIWSIMEVARMARTLTKEDVEAVWMSRDADVIEHEALDKDASGTYPPLDPNNPNWRAGEHLRETNRVVRSNARALNTVAAALADVASTLSTVLTELAAVRERVERIEGQTAALDLDVLTDRIAAAADDAGAAVESAGGRVAEEVGRYRLTRVE